VQPGMAFTKRFKKGLKAIRMLFVIVGFIQNRFMDGATPERLLKAENKKVFYYDSRDTKKSWFDEVIWQKKEMVQFVTDFILNNLKI
jgi:hypothetical protein